MRTLFCLLDGEPLEKAFHISIADDDTSISELKKLIKEETKWTLRDVDAKHLDVYRVSIPSGDQKALEDAKNGIGLGENPKLDPLDTIREVFPDPGTRRIHIMVHCPSKHTEKELLLLTPPSLSYIPDNQRRKKTKTTTKSTWARTPVSVVGWQDFIEQTRAMAFENQTPQYDKPVFRRYEISNEEGVRHALMNNVLLALSDTIGSNFDPPEKLLHSSASLAVRGIPDFILTDHARLMMAIEVKTKWGLVPNDIVDVYLENIQDIATQRTSQVSVVDPVKQIYGYLCHNTLQYGVLTTYDKTWFLMRPQRNPGELCISEVVMNTAANPTLLQCFAYIMALARRDPNSPSPSASPPPPADDYEPPSQKDDDGDSTYDPSEDSSPRGGERRKRVCRRGTGNTGRENQAGAKGNQWGADGGQPQGLLRLEHFGWKSFDVGEVLGTGRSGTVFKAVFRGEEVALKLCDLWQHPEYEKEMLTEVRAYYGLKRLQGHTIPKLQAAGYTAGGLFAIATELAGSPVEVEELSDQERSKIVSALSTIHDHGFLHKDVRPENILVQRDRGGFKVRFIDFALSERISSKGETEKEMAILRMMLGLPSRPINGRFKRLCLAKTRSME